MFYSLEFCQLKILMASSIDELWIWI